MKKILALVLALCMVFALCACGSQQAPAATEAPAADAPAADAPATEAPAADGKTSINVCIASEPDTIDPALNSAVDGATLVSHLFMGLAQWAQDDAGNLIIAPAAAEELVEGDGF